ncbi:nucleotidyltransferase domain-containing protein [Blautia marasmi]|uniref:nucleotidyltransferase domain-containing protein n=1 Tax=Blautia marasmi TaxID=1917868 RepID=UPI000CF25C4F|nr:nucleotidyltransferase domain-containing protein [Blautia marasmi]
MIRDAVNSCNELKYKDIDIFIQGSYANNTNVRSESDVDVCVMLRDTFHTVYAKRKGREDYGFSASNFTFQEYRDLVKKALQGKFRTVYCKIELPNVANGNWRMLHLQIGESCKTFAKSSQERCSA